MKLISSFALISGIPVRDLLKQIQFTSDDHDIQIALSMINGTNLNSEEARKQSHLTNATEMDHQIRFPLKARVDRHLIKLATACAHTLKKQNHMTQIEVHLSEQDYLSQVFFTELSRLGIAMHPASFNYGNYSDLLLPVEIATVEMIASQKMNLNFLIDYARERIYVGDYQTAYSVISNIPEADRTDACHHILGFCCNFFNRTTESEKHFKALLASSEVVAQVKATYVLSMLYLRLHPREMQSLEVAESYLNQGYKLIENNPNTKDYYFHSVFNRNGYALCLFRRGKVNEALDMLVSGIKKLQLSDDGAKKLHQSVLIYNAVQCLKNLKNFAECERWCEQLLEIDPLFPEYWLEAAIVYVEQNKLTQALAAIEHAENLDRFIPEVYALKGFIYLEQNQISLAVESYSQAVKLAPENLQYQSDLEYCNQQVEVG